MREGGRCGGEFAAPTEFLVEHRTLLTVGEGQRSPPADFIPRALLILVVERGLARGLRGEEREDGEVEGKKAEELTDAWQPLVLQRKTPTARYEKAASSEPETVSHMTQAVPFHFRPLDGSRT